MQRIPEDLLPVAKEEAFSGWLRYMLAMYWQGRGDKIPPRLMPVLEWLTMNALPKGQRGSRVFSHGRVMFEGEDHTILLDAVMQHPDIATN